MSAYPSPLTSSTVSDDAFTGALRAPTVNCQVRLDERVEVPGRTRQNTTPTGRSLAGVKLVPVTRVGDPMRVVHARFAHSSTVASVMPDASDQRSVGRRVVTIAVESGAIKRVPHVATGMATLTHAPPHA